MSSRLATFVLTTLALLACLLLAPSTSASPPEEAGDWCWPLDPDFEDPGCVKASTGCVCSYNITIAAGAYDNCEGCWVSFTGSRSCTFPHPSASYGSTLDAVCGEGKIEVEVCPCTGKDIKLFTMACKTCPS